MSEAAATRLPRLLALLPWLVAHNDVSIADCAAHFGVTTEQLTADLDQLIVCGLPGYGPGDLVDIQYWDDDYIHVVEPHMLDRPLRLTHEEATALLLALRLLDQLPGVEDRDALATATDKLERLAHETGGERFVAVAPAVAAGVRSAIDEALRTHHALDIRYASGSTGEITERTIQPGRLFAVDGVGYLEAYCLSAEARRTFRLDRILSALVSELSVPEPPAADGDGSEDRVAVGVGQQEAVLDLAPGARWITDVHPVTAVSAADYDGHVVVHLPIHSLAWAQRLVLSLRGDAVALEPPELVSAVADGARAALAAYSDRLG